MSMDSASLPPELQKLVDEVPVELVRAGPERYAPLVPTVNGTWRFILDSFVPVTMVWTDWRKGFGCLTILEGITNDEIYHYMLTSKKISTRAGIAYSSLDLFIKRLDGNILLSPEESGLLAGAWLAAEGRPTNLEGSK